MKELARHLLWSTSRWVLLPAGLLLIAGTPNLQAATSTILRITGAFCLLLCVLGATCVYSSSSKTDRLNAIRFTLGCASIGLAGIIIPPDITITSITSGLVFTGAGISTYLWPPEVSPDRVFADAAVHDWI